MLELMQKKDESKQNDKESKCNDCRKIAGDLSKGIEILKETLELMKRKDVDEQNENAKLKFFPIEREDYVKVYVRISIVRIGDIDAVRQEIQCRIYMTLRWEESRLVGKDASNLDNIDWDPRYYFINAVNIQEHEEKRAIINGEPPQVLLRCSITATFKQVLDISKFPFDN